jgi:hypothetical protein
MNPKGKPPVKMTGLDQALVNKHRLTDKQARFVALYMAEGFTNSTQCYKEAYQVTNPKESTVKPLASKLLHSEKIQACLADHLKVANWVGDKEIVTTTEVLEVLKDILHKEDAENKDRIKAGEILLKHLNAFKDHNNSKASKQLNITTNKSTEDLMKELENLGGLVNNNTTTLSITNIGDIIDDEEDDDEDTDYEEI